MEGQYKQATSERRRELEAFYSDANIPASLRAAALRQLAFRTAVESFYKKDKNGQDS